MVAPVVALDMLRALVTLRGGDDGASGVANGVLPSLNFSHPAAQNSESTDARDVCDSSCDNNTVMRRSPAAQHWHMHNHKHKRAERATNTGTVASDVSNTITL
jgi:hypothetical protein